MKKLHIIFLFTFSVSSLFACDICGCGGGNFYMGLLPHFKSSFIGLRYHYMNYNTQLKSDPSQFSKNYYNTVEIWGGKNVGTRWQLLAFVPYHINKQIDDDGLTNTNGIGDATILANYKLFHQMKRRGKSGIENQLWIGGGIKLPLGKFNADVSNPNITVRDVNTQLGTGSVDLILNTIYNIRVGNWGCNSTLSYKANNAKNAYKFGNKFTANSIFYYRFGNEGVSLLPNLGVMYENTGRNSLNKQLVDATGGYITTASVGLELSFNKMIIGLNAQAPFSQKYADGQTALNWRGNIHLTFTL